MKSYTDIPQHIRDIVLGQARGTYQIYLLGGGETWSGSSLKGTARAWGPRYSESRDNLEYRINNMLGKIKWSATTKLVKTPEMTRMRRELVLKDPEGVEYVW